MKTLRLSLCAAAFLMVSASAVPQGRPHPPGLEDPSKNAPPLEAPINKVPMAKASQAHQDAAELLELSQSVSGDIDRATKGVLPKDLGERLKRIEKLSKKLRNELVL